MGFGQYCKVPISLCQPSTPRPIFTMYGPYSFGTEIISAPNHLEEGC